jgi:hypothetical protein
VIYGALADIVLIIHFTFIVFVLFGGLSLLYRGWLAWLHVPAMVWGALISFVGWICPLTPLENDLRHAAGEQGYPGSFIAHYLVPVIYPEDYDRGFAVLAGTVVIVVNVIIYGYILFRYWRRRQL